MSQQQEPEQIEILTENEQWSEYKLKDGTILKIKPVLQHVICIGYDAKGFPMYNCNINFAVRPFPAKENIKKPDLSNLRGAKPF